MNGILSVSSFCEVCSAISGSISWARCLSVVTAESEQPALFFAFIVKVGVVTAEASQSEKLREWHGIFYVLWMRGRM